MLKFLLDNLYNICCIAEKMVIVGGNYQPWKGPIVVMVCLTCAGWVCRERASRVWFGHVAMVIATLQGSAEAHHVEGLPRHSHGNTQPSEVFLIQLL